MHNNLACWKPFPISALPPTQTWTPSGSAKYGIYKLDYASLYTSQTYKPKSSRHFKLSTTLEMIDWNSLTLEMNKILRENFEQISYVCSNRSSH